MTLSLDTGSDHRKNMHTKIHPTPPLSGGYDLKPLENLDLKGVTQGAVGIVRIGAGTRSPAEGFRASADHELAYVVCGQVRVDTAGGSRIVNAGDVIVSSPAELHATTALVDTTIVYVLLNPGAKT
jgi:quercetin dioxygenase-like cupin family protein